MNLICNIKHKQLICYVCCFEVKILGRHLANSNAKIDQQICVSPFRLKLCYNVLNVIFQKMHYSNVFEYDLLRPKNFRPTNYEYQFVCWGFFLFCFSMEFVPWIISKAIFDQFAATKWIVSATLFHLCVLNFNSVTHISITMLHTLLLQSLFALSVLIMCSSAIIDGLRVFAIRTYIDTHIFIFFVVYWVVVVLLLLLRLLPFLYIQFNKNRFACV